jgi:nickel-dependent lactate racemase
VGKKDSGVVFGLMILAIDSNYLRYTYTFAKDGAIEKKLGDSIINEQLSYIVKDSTEFVFVEGDSTKETFSNKIVSFDKNNFTLMATDSTLLFFKRQ